MRGRFLDLDQRRVREPSDDQGFPRCNTTNLTLVIYCSDGRVRAEPFDAGRGRAGACLPECSYREGLVVPEQDQSHLGRDLNLPHLDARRVVAGAGGHDEQERQEDVMR